MIIAGDVEFNGDKFIFAIKTLSKTKIYFLYSLHDQTDFSSEEKQITKCNDLERVDPSNYLIGVYSRSLVTGTIKYWGDCNVIRILLDNISYANNYTFIPENVIANTKETVDADTVKFFEASDKNLHYSTKCVNGEITYMKLSRGVLDLTLKESKLKLTTKNIELKDADKNDAKHVLISTIKTIRLADLDNALDMSWYHVGDKTLKNYSNAKNNFEFETKVFTPIVKAMLKAKQSGHPLLLSLDTETTGLNTLNLAEDNPSRSHIVAVQLSWEEDQGVAVFLDMEHFQNADTKYVMHRLGELFEWYEGSRTIEYWDTDCIRKNEDDGVRYSNSPIPQMMHFGLAPQQSVKDNTVSAGAKNTSSLDNYEKKSVTVQRSDFFLVGHNFPFDRRTCYQTDHVAIWFNADTLQMAFDLNPRTVRGNTKLKLLTRKLFGHETPELTDILGRGNEDKYKYLVDEEVADIYGCADVDYTRKLFKKLRSLMTDKMWKRYLQQDVDLPNILSISEYYGMMTYPDKVVSLAEQTYQNIEILKEAAYSYVGAYQDYNAQRILIESAYMTGLCTEGEYEEKLKHIRVDPKATYRFEFKSSSLIDVLYNILHYPIFAHTDKGSPKVDKYCMKKLADVKRKPNSTARELKEDILAYGVDRQEYEQLKAGSERDKKKADGMCLISAEKFNKLEYPLALIMQEYAALNKEYTSYYKPIIEQNLEGKIFKGYNMARIETRRIANPGQTMKANLKALVRSYDDDHYVLDFDMSQVEYRIMLSLSGFTEMIDKMKNPERDYHTETASMVNNKPAYKISKYERKHAKSVSFGVPYGLGDRSLCETMFGEVTQDNLVETRITLAKWKERNAPIMQLLETARAEALEPWDISDDFRDFIDAWQKDKKTGKYLLDNDGNKIPKVVGRVTNKLGFYRVFDLTGIGQTPADKQRRAQGEYTAEESSIRRKAGNFPVQSYAAEVFRTILTRFYWRCVKEGIEDKIIWHMLIHDELLCSVHKSLHPMYIYKLVKESCMITMKGHTKYFVGINIGDTWAECKDDAREAPVFFVDRMIKRWDAGDFAPEKTDPKFLKNGDPKQGYWFDHPWEFIEPLRKKYVEDRIGEVIRSIQDIDNGPINVPELLRTFDNYTVRAYVNDYPMNSEVSKSDYAIPAAGDDVYDEGKYYDAVWSSKLESWALTQFPEGKEFIDADGNHKRLSKVVKVEEAPKKELLAEELFSDDDDISLELDDDSADDYWSFDEGQLGMTFEQPDSFLEEIDEYDLNNQLQMDVVGAKSVNDLLAEKPKYKTIKCFNGQVKIEYVTRMQLDKLKKYLSEFICSDGYTVIFKDPLGQLTRWIKITDKVNLNELDEKVTEIVNDY